MSNILLSHGEGGNIWQNILKKADYKTDLRKCLIQDFFIVISQRIMEQNKEQKSSQIQKDTNKEELHVGSCPGEESVSRPKHVGIKFYEACFFFPWFDHFLFWDI